MELNDGIIDTLGVICVYFYYWSNKSKLDKVILKLGV